MGAVVLMRRWRRVVKSVRRLRRVLLRNKVAVGLALLMLFIGGLTIVQKYSEESDIYRANYRPLLDTIARGESKGNYNAYFGHAANTKLKFTKMTVYEVMKWQREYIADGNLSSAVGKYQIISTTLESLVKQLDIDKNELFDEKMQDELALALLERRGANSYLEKRLSREQFAANLAMEWAALPRVIGDNPERSYYAGDGLNKVQISIDEIYTALVSL